jgi:hypothetical protein
MVRLATSAIAISGLLLLDAGAFAADFMIFAVDGKGNFGHGVGSTPDAARHFALSHCGNLECNLIDPGRQEGCMALAQSLHNGYIYGTGVAPTQRAAEEFSLSLCAEKRPVQTCKVAYSYCLSGH